MLRRAHTPTTRTRPPKHPRLHRFLQRLKAVLFVILVLAVLGAAGGCFLVRHLENSALYHPVSDLPGTPYALNLVHQNVNFRAEDGTALHGWWIPASYPKANVVLFHGNSGNIAYNLDLVPYFHEKRFNVFLFDYRGYGRSEGTPTESGLYLDGLAALEVAQKMNKFARPRLPLLFYAHSLGVAVALHTAAEAPVRPDALILESGFHSLTNVVRLLYPNAPVDRLLASAYPAAENAAKLDGVPKLFLHSATDETIPFASGRLLASEAASPKRIAVLSGGHNDHAWLVPDSPARAQVDAFIDDVLAPKE